METIDCRAHNGAEITLIRADAHQYQHQLMDRYRYGALLTSPPYTDRNKGTLGVNRMNDIMWVNQASPCIANYCAHADGIDGVVGLIDLPVYMSSKNTSTFENHLAKAGLSYHIFEARRYCNYQKTVDYHWWLIYKQFPSARERKVLANKKQSIEHVLSVRSNAGNNSKFYRAWSSVADVSGDTPDSFAATHVEFLLRTLIGAGNTILDPYMGTGYSLRQAQLLGINSIGVEINEGFYKGTTHAFQDALISDTATQLKNKTNVLQTSGTSRTEAAIGVYFSIEKAESDGLLTKQRCQELGIPPSARSRTECTLRTPGPGRPSHLYRVPSRYLTKS